MAEDETEFPGGKTLSRIIDSIKRPFESLLSPPAPVWDVSDEYDFSHSSRGTMIIFNNEYFLKHSSRPGSSIDASSLDNTFSKLGFEVQLYYNQTREQMMDILKKACKADHSNADCFGCAVLSHGDELYVVDRNKPGQHEREDLVYATDHVILTREIVALFTDKKCPTLQGKPRMFFMQACRGNMLDEGVAVTVVRDEVDAKVEDRIEVSPCPIYKDFLIMYATPPGHYAFRRPDTGSWFVEGLCKVLSTSDVRNQKLTKLLTSVIKLVSHKYESRSANLSISGKKQSPCFASMLVKDVYFHKSKKEATGEV